MRKEIGYAAVAGILLGLIVAFGVYRINSKVAKNKNNTTSSVKASPTPSPIGPKEFKVVLDKPNQNDVVTESSITVSGLTKPSLWIVASGENRDYITQADSSGGFSLDVNLTPGVNQIKVTALNSEGSQVSSGILIVYSASFVENGADDSTTKTATDSVDVKQKVAQDLAKTLNHPKAYIGTVTDVTGSTIEIKSKKGDIEQISIGTQTLSVINSVGTTTKTVKITDIAIGDFIVAMGYVTDNSVLSAQRILITVPITDPKTELSMAKVTDTGRNSISTSSLPGDEPGSITLNAKTRIEAYKDGKVVAAKLATISDTDTVIYAQVTDSKDQTTTRSVFILTQ